MAASRQHEVATDSSASSTSSSSSAGGVPAGFAICRPPGHHSLPSRAMGFCIFGNVAVAARYAQRQHGLKQVRGCAWRGGGGWEPMAGVVAITCAVHSTLECVPSSQKQQRCSTRNVLAPTLTATPNPHLRWQVLIIDWDVHHGNGTQVRAGERGRASCREPCAAGGGRQHAPGHVLAAHAASVCLPVLGEA